MPNHLLRKFIAFTIIWLLFALLFVGITLSITWRLEDRGMAINEAGSLRKQSYLMVALVQAGDSKNLPKAINEFESKMQDLARLKHGSLGSEIQNQYLLQLNTVQAGFVSFKTQILAAQNDSSVPPNLLLETQTFVNNINELVKIYNDLNGYFQLGANYPGWLKDVYPVISCARGGVPMEDGGAGTVPG